MTVAILVLAGVVVFAIAAVAVGRATADLAAMPRQTIVDIEAALVYVVDLLDDAVTAQLSHDDVRAVIRWQLDDLDASGLLAVPGTNVVASDRPVVVGGDRLREAMVARAAVEELDVDESQLGAIIDAHFAYLRAVGAIGPTVPDPTSGD